MSAESKKLEIQQLLGDFIRMKRLELSWTQEQLGINVGYSPATAKQSISQLERGQNWIPGKKLEDFINTLMLDRSFFQLLSYHYNSGSLNEAHEMLERLHAYTLRQKRQDIAPELSAKKENSSPEKELEQKLGKLQELFDKGLIDQEDYTAMKREALRKYIG